MRRKGGREEDEGRKIEEYRNKKGEGIKEETEEGMEVGSGRGRTDTGEGGERRRRNVMEGVKGRWGRGEGKRMDI